MLSAFARSFSIWRYRGPRLQFPQNPGALPQETTALAIYTTASRRRPKSRFVRQRLIAAAVIRENSIPTDFIGFSSSSDLSSGPEDSADDGGRIVSQSACFRLARPCGKALRSLGAAFSRPRAETPRIERGGNPPAVGEKRKTAFFSWFAGLKRLLPSGNKYTRPRYATDCGGLGHSDS
jgi:hypothetical protein